MHQLSVKAIPFRCMTLVTSYILIILLLFCYFVYVFTCVVVGLSWYYTKIGKEVETALSAPTYPIPS